MPNNKYDIIICDQCGRQSEPDMRFCTYCGAALTKNPIDFSSTSSSTSTNTESEAGSLLFQRLQSKTNQKQKQPNRLKPISKSPKTVSSTAKMKRVARPKPKKPAIRTVTVIDSKLKLKLLEQLKDLNKLDRTLEASAIIRYRDHNVLAAATSTRTSENLMVTIASTIFDICSDSIKALGGGKIRILNITAEQITLLLSPIDSDTVLIVVTNPKSNVGLISMYMEITCERVRGLLQIPA